ncbi:hypothetical protein CLF_100216 [Clonorchis sinensis]|uniref:Endonuclease/exonuclease/phosphatase domain-containing protein n=1 Tax=Clonorchis sinensis TaxID=79923 RepID=G7Y2Z4_CLOSI|nr:hypothetical protein CLF_100216 [Clonorchis sinensis]
MKRIKAFVLKRKNRKPSFVDLTDYVLDRANSLPVKESYLPSASPSSTSRSDQSRNDTTAKVLHIRDDLRVNKPSNGEHNTTISSPCMHSAERYYLDQCTQFVRLNADSRATSVHSAVLCKISLKPRHNAKQCRLGDVTDSSNYLFARQRRNSFGVSDVEISIDGYSVFRADSKRGRAGWIALYLHAALPISIVLSDTTPAPFCDALWLHVPLCGSESLLLGVVYRSPSSPPEDDHFLIWTLEQLSSSYRFTHLLLVGDFNAPKAPWTELQCVGSSGPFAAALTEVVQQNAWTQHVVAPTRYRAGQQPSLLDLVITNERHFADQVIINAPLGHSDHCVLTFDFICYWARNPEPQTWIRNFCRADFSGMRIFLDQVKMGPASVEDLYRTIVQKVHEADAMFVPKKPARSRMSRKLPKRIRRLLEKRSQLFFKKLTTGDTEDELAFRKMRNRCKSEIRQWNIRKQATILDLARKNRNVLFKYMGHRRRNKPSAFSLRDRIGEPTSDPIVVSEFYRDHYAERTKDVILIERVQRAATKMVAGLKSVDYETRLAVIDLFPLEYRRLRGDLILTYALFEQGLANRLFTVDPANTRRGHGKKIFKLRAHTFIRLKSEIRQWNIRKQATILDLARKNRNVLFKYMRHRRRNKPSAFSLRDRNGEPTSDPIVVSEFYRDHYAEIGSEGIRCPTNDSAHLLPYYSSKYFQILYGAYVRPLLEYANPVVCLGRTKDVILIDRVQRAATKMVAGLQSMDYETRLTVLDLFPLEYRRLRGDLILTYALFEQGLVNRFPTVDPAKTRRGHGERQPLNDKNKTDPETWAKASILCINP